MVENWDGGFDFVARRNGVKAYVEVKLRQRVSAADIREAQGMLERLSRDQGPGTRYILAVNNGALSAAAQEALSAAGPLEVMEVPVEGW